MARCLGHRGGRRHLMIVGATWAELLAELDASISAVEQGGMAASVDLAWANGRGPIPDELREWAASLAGRAVRLEARMVAELQSIETELGRHAPRLRGVQPPAPSHLDQLA